MKWLWGIRFAITEDMKARQFLRKRLRVSQLRILAILFIAAGLFLVEACGRTMKAQPSCNFVENQNLQRVSWSPNDLPVNLYLDSSVPQQYIPTIEKAIAIWNQVGQSIAHEDFFVLRSGDPGSSSPTQDGYNKIYFVHTWTSTTDNEQGLTTVYWAGSRIYEANIRINATGMFQYFTSSTNPNRYSDVDFESLILHELGHALGLAHTTASDSVMQPSLANGQIRNTPGPTDYKDLACQYGT